MREEIGRFPKGHHTVKAEKEKLLAGRLVTYDGQSAEGDDTAIHAAAKTTSDEVYGCVQRETADPKADPAPDPNDNELRTVIIRSGSIARVECSGEVLDGEEVQAAAAGKVAKVTDGTAIGKAQSDGDDSIIDVELY